MGVGSSSSSPKNLILYLHGLSAPSRAVWMTAKAADIPVTIRYLDLFKGEHKTPEFAKVSREILCRIVLILTTISQRGFKNIVETKKMLVTTIFSVSHNVSCHFKDKNNFKGKSICIYVYLSQV